MGDAFLFSFCLTNLLNFFVFHMLHGVQHIQTKKIQKPAPKRNEKSPPSPQQKQKEKGANYFCGKIENTKLYSSFIYFKLSINPQNEQEMI